MWRASVTYTTDPRIKSSSAAARSVRGRRTVDGLPAGGSQPVVEGALEPVPTPAALQRDLVDSAGHHGGRAVLDVDGRALVADRVVGELAGADLCQPLPLRRDVAGDVLRGERVVEDGVEQVRPAVDHPPALVAEHLEDGVLRRGQVGRAHRVWSAAGAG